MFSSRTVVEEGSDQVLQCLCSFVEGSREEYSVSSRFLGKGYAIGVLVGGQISCRISVPT